MSDTTLLELTTATVVSETEDYIPMVDVSDTTESNDGTTKKATVRKILGDKTLPTGDIVGTSDTQVLSGKTISMGNNTISDLEVGNFKSGVLDTDLSTVSDNDDTVPSAKAVKTYVDSTVDSTKAGGSYVGYLTSETSSTSSAQIGSAQVTVTTKGGNLSIIGTAFVKTSAATSGLILELDGSDIGTSYVLTNSASYVQLTTAYVKTSLVAGSHTVKLKYVPQIGHTVYTAAFMSHSLIVTEL